MTMVVSASDSFSFSSKLLRRYFLCLFFILRRTIQQSLPNYACDVLHDTCPTKFNGVCDDITNFAQCSGGDCFDCDSCSQFDLDCISCLTKATGCYWCAGQGACLNSNYYKFGTCQTQGDYSATTCSSPKSFFKYVFGRYSVGKRKPSCGACMMCYLCALQLWNANMNDLLWNDKSVAMNCMKYNRGPTT